MTVYIIYEIKGRKVGCTKDVNWRMHLYEEMDGVAPEIEVLEELHDKTDQEAGDIEWQWADKLGYKRGNHYTLSMNGNAGWGRKTAQWRMDEMTSEQRSEVARKGGHQRMELMTPEDRSEFGKMGGNAYAISTSPEKRSEVARKGADGLAKVVSSDQRRAWFRQAASVGGRVTADAELAGFQQRVKCPHCGVEGNIAGMHRWHFDRCPRRGL